MTRDDNGRFVKGISGNPKGRAVRVAEDDFKRLIDRVVLPADWIAIIAKAKEQATRGDNRAREWLTDRRYGKAPLPIQHSGEDGGPIEIGVRLIDYRIDIAQTETRPGGDSSASGEDESARYGPKMG